MAEQKESSVLFSLKELMNLEENRIKEEEDAKKRAADAEVQAKADAERRAREEEEARLRAEEERRRQDEMRRKMEEAQIEAAKHAEIEKRKLEQQHLLQMEALAKQQAHEKEIHAIQAQKRKGVHPGVLGGIGVLLLGAVLAIVFVVAIKPANDAKEAVLQAQKLAASDDPAEWAKADGQLEVARKNDPNNKDIAAVAEKIKSKRDKKADELAAKEKQKEDELKAYKEKTAKLQKDIEDAQNELKSATSEDAKKAAAAKIAAAQAGMAKAGPAPTAAKKACPPGVPLCN